MSNESNIVRRAGDTYPTKVTLKIGGVPINLDEWRVELRYKDTNGLIKVIDGLPSDVREGKILIYPHARNTDDEPLAYEDFISNDMEGKDIPDTDPTEQYGASNQVWDEDEANHEYPYHVVRLKKYGEYIEEQTHIVGKIQLLSRFE
jgi:hypothetical protein